MHLRSVACSALVLLPVVQAAWGADRLSIRSLAPQKSILVAGIDDLDASRERFALTPLSAWWHSPEVTQASREWREGLDRSLDRMTQELGVPRESVAWPSSIGVALYGELDEETGTEAAAFFAFVDWAKEAEKFEALYEAAIKRLERERKVPFEIEEIKGRRVYVFPIPDEADADADDFDDFDDFDDMGFGSPVEFDRYCVTRDGSRLLLSSGVAAMEDLIVAVEGDRARRIADNDDFKGSMELVGASPDVFAVLLTGPIQTAAAQFAGPQFAFVQPTIAKLFGDIRGYSFGLTVDGKEAPLEQSIGIFVPGRKVGLLSLLAAGPIAGAPPIVPADAIGYNRINVRAADLMRIVEDVVAGLPEMQGEQVKMLLEPFGPTLKTALGAMGPAIHVWDTVQRPVTPESQRTVAAVAVSDQKAAESLLQVFGPQVGLAPRDFLGNAIYAGEDPTFAVGFGGRFMFLGSTDSVEQGLRAVGRAEGGGLDEDPVFRQAMSGVRGDDLIGYGFTDTIESLQVQKSLLDQVQMMGIVGEEGSNKLEIAAIDLDVDLDFEQLRKLLNPELAKEYFGPSIWTLRSVERGFRTDFRLLAPTKASTRE